MLKLIIVVSVEKFRTRLSRGLREEPYLMLVNNFRAVQNIGSRHIYSSDPKHASLLTAPLESPISFTIAIFLGIVVIFVIIGKGDQS